MSVSVKVRLKVSSVESVQDSEGKENIRIILVEDKPTPPIASVMPQNISKEISSVVFQVQKGLQQALPGHLARSEFQKIVLVLSPEELEAFHIRPYPSQLYEVTLSDGNISFKKLLSTSG